jgi:hypothetical protein
MEFTGDCTTHPYLQLYHNPNLMLDCDIFSSSTIIVGLDIQVILVGFGGLFLFPSSWQILYHF